MGEKEKRREGKMDGWRDEWKDEWKEEWRKGNGRREEDGENGKKRESNPIDESLSRMSSSPIIKPLEPWILLAKSTSGAATVRVIEDALSASGVFVFAELLDLSSIQEVTTLCHTITSHLIISSFTSHHRAISSHRTRMKSQSSYPPPE